MVSVAVRVINQSRCVLITKRLCLALILTLLLSVLSTAKGSSGLN